MTLIELRTERARTHLSEVEQHRDDLAGEIEAEDMRSAEALIVELAEGDAGQQGQTSQIAAERRVVLASAEAEMTIAQRAVTMLTAEHEAARRQLAAASRAVLEGAIGVL